MTWLQIDAVEWLFEGARQKLAELCRPAPSPAMTVDEARAALAAERHLEVIRQPHALSSFGARAFMHLL
jgi:hypothetical protein